MSKLVLKNVARRYGAVEAVADFSLALAPGEFVSLLGPSGCGKTTTLRMIAGFAPPSAGTIEMDGQVISSANADTGYSPITSGRPRTTVAPRPVRNPPPTPRWPRVVAPPATGMANIAPPRRSRLPVTMFTTSMSHDANVPNSVVVVPIRPYTEPDAARARSRATARVVAASMPVASATDSAKLSSTT